MPKMTKISPDGEAIPSTPEEESEAVEALKGIFNGSIQVRFAPGVEEDLKKMGITEDELMAMLAKDLGVDN